MATEEWLRTRSTSRAQNRGTGESMHCSSIVPQELDWCSVGETDWQQLHFFSNNHCNQYSYLYISTGSCIFFLNGQYRCMMGTSFLIFGVELSEPAPSVMSHESKLEIAVKKHAYPGREQTTNF